MFNTLQLMELMALIELEYPDKLEQFFHGFEFALMNTPPKLNFVKRHLIEEGKDSAFTERMESFGFESSFLLVQQIVPFTFGFGIICLLIITKAL